MSDNRKMRRCFNILYGRRSYERTPKIVDVYTEIQMSGNIIDACVESNTDCIPVRMMMCLCQNRHYSYIIVYLYQYLYDTFLKRLAAQNE